MLVNNVSLKETWKIVLVINSPSPSYFPPPNMLINSHNLGIVSHTNKSNMRPVLSGIYFTDKVSVATDGYRLLEVELPNIDANEYPAYERKEEFEPCIIPATAIAKVKTPKNVSLDILKNVHLSSTKERAVLSVTDLETVDRTESRVIDGNFPAYEKIMPEKDKGISVSLDAKYLKEIADYFAKHEADGAVEIQVTGALDCVGFTGTTDAGQKIRGVLMPRRSKDS